MKAPQIIMIVLLAFNLAIGLCEHGKPKTGTQNFWATLIGCALTAGLLWWGGFWG
jgi:LPXTG-motif cell wall-anchored protein